jgi:hypothetical protein
LFSLPKYKSMDLFGHLRVNFDYGVQFNGHNECEINNNNNNNYNCFLSVHETMCYEL